MSAVLKKQNHHFETIFDYSVTEDELMSLLFGDIETLDEYLQFRDKDSALADISRLMRLRGDIGKANNCINKISDKELKAQFKTTPCVVVGRSFAEHQVYA